MVIDSASEKNMSKHANRTKTAHKHHLGKSNCNKNSSFRSLQARDKRGGGKGKAVSAATTENGCYTLPSDLFL